jgi:pimeloyl-ACP methyl ester carboxylesterase
VIAWLVPARLNHPGMYEVEDGEVMEIATLEGHRHYAHTPSGPVSYLDIGEGDATVFIHGVITNSLLWRRVISAVTPAATSDADVSMVGLAERVIELCDHLCLDRIDLVANDTGSAVNRWVPYRPIL